MRSANRGAPERKDLAEARDAAAQYRAKVEREAALAARESKKAGYPEPLGDPASGVLLVVEGPPGPRLVEALRRSLDAVGHPEAYVAWAGSPLLSRQILSAEPAVLVAVGPESRREIDALGYPLARRSFSKATEGVWFAWSKGTAGLALPALAPALRDEAAKRNFWRAFLALKALAPGAAEQP